MVVPSPPGVGLLPVTESVALPPDPRRASWRSSDQVVL